MNPDLIMAIFFRVASLRRCKDFPGGSVVKNPPAVQDIWVQSLGQEDSLEKEMATHSYLGNPMDRGAWQATVHGITRVGHDLATKPPPPHCDPEDSVYYPCRWCVANPSPWALVPQGKIFMFRRYKADPLWEVSYKLRLKVSNFSLREWD